MWQRSAEIARRTTNIDFLFVIGRIMSYKSRQGCLERKRSTLLNGIHINFPPKKYHLIYLRNSVANSKFHENKVRTFRRTKSVLHVFISVTQRQIHLFMQCKIKKFRTNLPFDEQCYNTVAQA